MCDDSVSIEDIIEPVTIQIISLHQIPAEPSELVPPNTTDHIDSLWMALSIIRGDGASCCRKVATGKSRILRSMFPRVIWNQKLTLDIEIKNLPLDASLLIELYCTATVPDRNIEKGMVVYKYSINKVTCVFPMLISSEFPMWHYRDDGHRGDALIFQEKSLESLFEPKKKFIFRPRRFQYSIFAEKCYLADSSSSLQQ